MWHQEYKDYPPDSPLKKTRSETGKGVTGCEMNEPFGWGEAYQIKPPKKRGLFAFLIELLLK
jgi:hypothetical protein